MFVGIGVLKRTIELAATGEAPGLPSTARNTPEGVAAIVAALQDAAPRLIAISTTGSAYLPLLAWMVVAELPVATVSPAQVATIRQQGGADGSDAQLLARFAEMHHAELRPIALGASDRSELREVVDYRDLRAASKTRARKWQLRATTEGNARLAEFSARDLAQAETQVREVDAMIASMLNIQPESGS